NAACNAVGYGGGQSLIGTLSVVTNALGIGSFSLNGLSLTVGQGISATATDADGNTSEFSQCVTVLPGRVTIDSVVLDSTILPIDGANVPYTATITNGTANPVTVFVQASIQQ